MTSQVQVLSLLALALLAASAAHAQPTPGQSTPQQSTPTQSPAAKPAPAQSAPAQSAPQSARQVFEFHDLIGTFAINCDRPLGPRNPNAVYSAQGDGTVEFALRIGANRRLFTYIIDWAEEISPGELSFSMVNSNDETRVNVLYLMDGGSIRAMESTREEGERLIAGGYSTAKLETQWFNKCR